MDKSKSELENKDVLIKTDVDSLVKLVEQKKEISFSDAAKELGVPEGTVEAWANYLEEEEILGIKYKLTTPYLISNQTKKASGPSSLPKIKLPKKQKFPAAHLNEKPGEEKSEDFEMLDLLPELSKNMNEMLQKAYSLLEQGKFEEANRLYQIIKSKHADLPSRLNDVKRNVDVKLTKLNKDLSLHIKNKHAKNSKELSKKIKSKLKKLNFILLRRDIKKAEELYKEIEVLYAEFPDSFAVQKAKLQGNILSSYEKLVKLRESLLLKYTNIKIKELSDLIEKIKLQLKNKQVDLAFKSYEQIRSIYNMLPQGYSKQRAKVEKQIFDLIPILISLKEEQSIKIVTKNRSTIINLMQKTHSLIGQNKLQQASKTYEQARKLYNQLPKQIGRKGIDIEEKLIHLNKLLIVHKNKHAIEDLEAKTKRINKLLKMANNYVEQGNIDMADGVYYEILHHYSTLPRGFMHEQTKMRVDILKLYRDLLVRGKKPILKDFDDYTEKRYKQLVKLLVDVREHISNSEFNILESKYKAIRELYGHLPLSLVQEKSRISQEIGKLYHEVETISIVNKLDKLTKKEEINRLLVEIKSALHTFSKKYPEDMKLWNWVRSKYEQYIQGINKPKDVRSQALLNTLLTKAHQYEKSGKTIEAQALYRRAYRLDSNNPNLRHKIENGTYTKKPESKSSRETENKSESKHSTEHHKKHRTIG
ncbi:MAG: hypothetical protein MAG795_00938 [Candidatus Woesearchaeota archaeon]|nr:hypothetical protein [Candidatus Woesearchaeota archaeon]